MKNPVKVAIIGAGNVATEAHLPAWRRIPQAQVVAVCDVDKKRAEATAKRWKIPRQYSDFDTLLEREIGCVVDICTPPDSHMEMSVLAMRAGCHVLIEKPLAMSRQEISQILDAYTEQQSNGIRLGVIHSWLYEPAILQLDALAQRDIGEILAADVSMLLGPDDTMLADPKHWCHALPGGRFGECLIHPIYVLQQFIGPLMLDSVWVAKRGQFDWVPFDEVHATFHSGNRFGSIFASFNSARMSQPTLNIYGKNAHLRYEGGTMGLVRLPELRPGSDFGRGMDAARQIYGLTKSAAQNTLVRLSGRWKTQHTNYFGLFVDAIITDSELPSAMEPKLAYIATESFLELLERLENMETVEHMD